MADLLKTAEVAQLLGKSKRTIHRWANSGKLRLYHRASLGGDLYFRRSVVEEKAAEMKAGSAPTTTVAPSPTKTGE